MAVVPEGRDKRKRPARDHDASQQRNPLRKHRSRSHDAVISVYDDAGKLIEVHEHKGDFKEW